MNATDARPGSNARSTPRGHGTRPAHARTAQSTSASAAPGRARLRWRESFTRASPASIHAPHCHPAVRSKSRIASFLASCTRVSLASPMSWAAADNASASAIEPQAGSALRTDAGAARRRPAPALRRDRRAPHRGAAAHSPMRSRCARRRRAGSLQTGFHHVERTGQRPRLPALAAVERVAFDVRAGFRRRSTRWRYRVRAGRPILRAAASEDRRGVVPPR